MNLLQALNRTQGKTIVMVTHDPKAAEYASRELHLDKGQLVDEASEKGGMKYFGLIWAGLWRKRARTLFTMASIVVAFLLFGLLQGLNQGFQTVVTNLNVDRLYVSAKTNMTDGLPISYGARIKAVPGVRAVSHWTYFGGYFQNATQPDPGVRDRSPSRCSRSTAK